MSKITFSENQIEVLQCNPYVKRVTEKSITWIVMGISDGMILEAGKV